MADRPLRLIVAITGATGAVYGVRLLRQLSNTNRAQCPPMQERRGVMAGYIWTPLFDTPMVLHTSREQIQALQEELREINVYPGWKEWFADQLEGVLTESLKDEPGSEPTA